MFAFSLLRACTRLLLLALLPGAASGFAQQPASEYTSTKSGVVLQRPTEEPGGDSFKTRCRGFGGYELLLLGGDARSWINIKYRKTEVDLLNATLAVSPGTFPNKANDTVEWRGIHRGRDFIPYAIIYRLQGGNDETRKIKSRLVVIQLDRERSSIVGFAEGKNEEEESRQIADRFRPK